MSDSEADHSLETTLDIQRDLTAIWEGRFNAYQTADSTKSMDAVSDALRDALTAWNDDCGQSTSEKMVLLFQQELPTQSPRLADLIGMDAWRARFVSSTAEKLGFSTGIANLVLYQRGLSNDSYSKCQMRYGARPDQISDSEDAVAFSEADLDFVKSERPYDPDNDENVFYKKRYGYTGPYKDLRVERFGELDGTLIRSTPQSRTASYRELHTEDDSGFSDEEDEVDERPENANEINVKSEATDAPNIKAEKTEPEEVSGFRIKSEDSGNTLPLKTEPETGDSLLASQAVQDQDSLSIDVRLEGIPTDLYGAIMNSGRHNRQVYAGFELTDGDDYVAGPLHRSGNRFYQLGYYRAALVIWPGYTDRLVRHQATVESICEGYRTARSTQPTSGEHKLARYLAYRHCMTDAAPAVLQGVTEAAIRWNDKELWCLAAERCAPKCGLGPSAADAVQRAFTTFGFPAIRSSVTHIVEKDEDNARVFGFLRAMRKWLQDPEWCSAQDIKASQADVSAWVEQQIEQFKQSLRRPEKDDFDIFEKLAEDTPDAAEFWTKSILPQIIPKADYRILQSYSERMYAEGAPQLDPDTKRSLAEQLLQACMASIDKGHQCRGREADDDNEENGSRVSLSLCPRRLDVLKSIMQTCLRLKCLKAATQMLIALADVSEINQWHADERFMDLTLPLLAFLDGEYKDSNEDLPADFRAALHVLQEATFTGFSSSCKGSWHDIREKDLSNIVLAALLPGDRVLAIKSVLARINSLKLKAVDISTLIEVLHPLLPRISQVLQTETNPTAFFDTAVRQHAALTPISSLQEATNSFERYLRLGVRAAFRDLLQRILDPADLTARFSLDSVSGEREPPNALYGYEEMCIAEEGGEVTKPVTLVGKLRAILARYPQGDTSSTEADDTLSQSSVCSDILGAWTRNVLGPKPLDASNKLAEVDRWEAACTHPHCRKLRAFFRSPSRSLETKLLYVETPDKRLVESCLKQNVTAASATWEWKYSSVSKHTLALQRAELIRNHIVWHNCKAIAVQMLQEVGSSADEQAHILGDDYMDFSEWISGLSKDEARRRCGLGDDSIVIESPNTATAVVQETLAATAEGSTRAQVTKRGRAGETAPSRKKRKAA